MKSIAFTLILFAFSISYAIDFDSMEKMKNQHSTKQNSVKDFDMNRAKKVVDGVEAPSSLADRAIESMAKVASSNSGNYVMINFESVCGFVGCKDKNLQISGGTGTFSPNYNKATSGAIHKGYSGLVGQYSWRAQVDNIICSGNFYLSGKKKNYSIRVYKRCDDAGSNEY